MERASCLMKVHTEMILKKLMLKGFQKNPVALYNIGNWARVLAYFLLQPQPKGLQHYYDQ
ncbi:unnamed protein product [Rhodiola kirilowii]